VSGDECPNAASDAGIGAEDRLAGLDRAGFGGSVWSLKIAAAGKAGK